MHGGRLCMTAHVLPRRFCVAAAALLVCSKTRFCVDLMRQHVVNKGYWASVWFMSHTSSDPSVGLSGDIVTGAYVAAMHFWPAPHAVLEL